MCVCARVCTYKQETACALKARSRDKTSQIDFLCLYVDINVVLGLKAISFSSWVLALSKVA